MGSVRTNMDKLNIQTVADLKKHGLKPTRVSMEPPIETDNVLPGTQELGMNGMYQLGFVESGEKKWLFLGANEQAQAFENAVKGVNGLAYARQQAKLEKLQAKPRA